MITAFVLTAILALAGYIAVPLIGLYIRRHHRRILWNFLTQSPPSQIRFQAVTVEGSLQCRRGQEIITILPSGTRFYIWDHQRALIRVRWSVVHRMTRDALILYARDSSEREKPVVILPGPDGEPARLPKDGKLYTESTEANPVVPYAVAVTIFAEFALLLRFTADPALRPAAIAALLGIIGKALPWCPPGLILTHAAKKHNAKKKNRYTAGTGLVYTAGVLLNVAVIYLIIHITAFGSFR